MCANRLEQHRPVQFAQHSYAAAPVEHISFVSRNARRTVRILIAPSPTNSILLPEAPLGRADSVPVA